MPPPLRTLLKTPWISAVIVVSLALGIGANAVVFSWFNSSLLRPLPQVTAEVVGLEARRERVGVVVGGVVAARLPERSGHDHADVRWRARPVCRHGKGNQALR